MRIEINPSKIARILLSFVLFLMIANILGIVSKLYFDHDHVFGLIRLFNFDNEKNIPTLYSSIALILTAGLLSLIAYTHKKSNHPYVAWVGLAIIFLFLAIDETASIHENLISPVRETLHTSGVLYFAWVIPYGLALIIFVISYFKFLTQLPKRFMRLFILSGSTFVTGAIGFELLGGRQAEIYGRSDPTYALYYTCEEFLEMLGVIIFIYTLLTYIIEQFNILSINVIKTQRLWTESP